MSRSILKPHDIFGPRHTIELEHPELCLRKEVTSCPHDPAKTPVEAEMCIFQSDLVAAANEPLLARSCASAPA